jgi:hypothetical protein
MAVLDDGGVLLVGDTDAKGAGKKDLWMLRVDAVGNLSWDKTWGGAGDDSAYGAAALADGFALSGETSSKGAGGTDGLLLRVNALGTTVWEKVLGGPLNDSLTRVLELPDGGVVAVGYTLSKGAGGTDAWAVRTDAVGGVMWEHTFGGAKSDDVIGVAAGSAGSLVLAGGTMSKGAVAASHHRGGRCRVGPHIRRHRDGRRVCPPSLAR